METYAIS